MKFSNSRKETDEEYYSYIKKLFRRWAPVYDFFEIFTSKLRGKVVDFTNAKHGSKILDISTGTGKQAFAFGKRGYEVIGIDISEDMLKVAKKKNKYNNVKFEIADAVSMQFKDSHFDVSCISFGLHEMPLPIRGKVLKETVRVTKPKGAIVVVDYALPKNKIIRYFVYHLVKSFESKYYEEYINSDLKALLTRSGIKIQGEIPVLLGLGKILKGKNYGI